MTPATPPSASAEVSCRPRRAEVLKQKSKERLAQNSFNAKKRPDRPDRFRRDKESQTDATWGTAACQALVLESRLTGVNWRQQLATACRHRPKEPYSEKQKTQIIASLTRYVARIGVQAQHERNRLDDNSMETHSDRLQALNREADLREELKKQQLSDAQPEGVIVAAVHARPAEGVIVVEDSGDLVSGDLVPAPPNGLSPTLAPVIIAALNSAFLHHSQGPAQVEVAAPVLMHQACTTDQCLLCSTLPALHRDGDTPSVLAVPKAPADLPPSLSDPQTVPLSPDEGA